MEKEINLESKPNVDEETASDFLLIYFFFFIMSQWDIKNLHIWSFLMVNSEEIL